MRVLCVLHGAWHFSDMFFPWPIGLDMVHSEIFKAKGVNRPSVRLMSCNIYLYHDDLFRDILEARICKRRWHSN